MSKKIEVDEAVLAQLQRGTELLTKLNNNPAARTHLEKSLKILNPDLETEEDIVARNAKPFVEQISALQARLDKADADRAAELAAATANQDAAQVARATTWLDENNYTDAGKAAIQKLMVDERIPSVEAAAALFDKRNPKPVQVAGANYESDSWNLRGDEKDENLKALFENEDRWADNEAARALNDIRRQAQQVAA